MNKVQTNFFSIWHKLCVKFTLILTVLTYFNSSKYGPLSQILSKKSNKRLLDSQTCPKGLEGLLTVSVRAEYPAAVHVGKNILLNVPFPLV